MTAHENTHETDEPFEDCHDGDVIATKGDCRVTVLEVGNVDGWLNVPDWMLEDTRVWA